MRNIRCKLGNMAKVADWTIYPRSAETPHVVIIQCNRRIAQIDTQAGTATLSSGKGGHQGFLALSPFMGAKEVPVPEEVLAELREPEAVHVGPIHV
jgi:hypothetical protein